MPASTHRVRARIVCFGELLLRLSAPEGRLLQHAAALDLCVGGAEANVAVSLSCLGHDAAMVSVAPDNALGQAAIDALRMHGVDTRGVARAAGRMGLYFLTPGAVLRPSEIVYDRAASAFAQAEPDSYDWPALLRGVDWLHVSGISPALGEGPAQAALAAMRATRKLGARVAFDGNYRASLWAARGLDGAATLAELLHEADLAFVGARDIALVLGRPELGAPGRDSDAVGAAFAAFPRLQWIAHTGRAQHGVDRHDLSAHLHTRDVSHMAGPLPLHHIVDRIGTGDAFAAGILDALLRELAPDAVAAFGLAAAAMKHSLAGDFSPASRGQIEALLEGSLDVRR